MYSGHFICTLDQNWSDHVAKSGPMAKFLSNMKHSNTKPLIFETKISIWTSSNIYSRCLTCQVQALCASACQPAICTLASTPQLATSTTFANEWQINEECEFLSTILRNLYRQRLDSCIDLTIWYQIFGFIFKIVFFLLVWKKFQIPTTISNAYNKIKVTKIVILKYVDMRDLNVNSQYKWS